MEEYLRKNMKLLRGSWVSKRSHYEKDFCRVLPMFTYESTRTHDCLWNGDHRVELKKLSGSGTWIPEVRMAEHVMEGDAFKDITIIWLVYEKDSVKQILFSSTKNLLKHMKLSPEWCECLRYRSSEVDIHCQQRIKFKDIEKISYCIIV
jgi:hypothetical protein